MFETGDRTKGFLHLKDVYFAPVISRRDPSYDLVYYFFCQEPYLGAQEYTTAVIDVSRNEEEILQSFRESTRRAIRKMQKDKGLVVDIEENPDHEQLEAFLSNYDKFTRHKGFYASDRQRVYLLFESGRLRLVTAYYHQEQLVQRILIEDTEKILPLYGYTLRLLALDKEKLQLISRISKMVDYQCILYGKEKNKKAYDLGGLFQNPLDSVGNQVDHYKEGFRGEIIKEYEFMYPLTWKGQLFCIFRKWIRKK